MISIVCAHTVRILVYFMHYKECINGYTFLLDSYTDLYFCHIRNVVVGLCSQSQTHAAYL